MEPHRDDDIELDDIALADFPRRVAEVISGPEMIESAGGARYLFRVRDDYGDERLVVEAGDGCWRVVPE